MAELILLGILGAVGTGMALRNPAPMKGVETEFTPPENLYGGTMPQPPSDVTSARPPLHIPDNIQLGQPVQAPTAGPAAPIPQNYYGSGIGGAPVLPGPDPGTTTGTTLDSCGNPVRDDVSGNEFGMAYSDAWSENRTLPSNIPSYGSKRDNPVQDLGEVFDRSEILLERNGMVGKPGHTTKHETVGFGPGGLYDVNATVVRDDHLVKRARQESIVHGTAQHSAKWDGVLPAMTTKRADGSGPSLRTFPMRPQTTDAVRNTDELIQTQTRQTLAPNVDGLRVMQTDTMRSDAVALPESGIGGMARPTSQTPYSQVIQDPTRRSLNPNTTQAWGGGMTGHGPAPQAYNYAGTPARSDGMTDAHMPGVIQGPTGHLAATFFQHNKESRAQIGEDYAQLGGIMRPSGTRNVYNSNVVREGMGQIGEDYTNLGGVHTGQAPALRGQIFSVDAKREDGSMDRLADGVGPRGVGNNVNVSMDPLKNTGEITAMGDRTLQTTNMQASTGGRGWGGPVYTNHTRTRDAIEYGGMNVGCDVQKNLAYSPYSQSPFYG